MSWPRAVRKNPRGIFCGFLVAYRVGQRFDSWLRPPPASMETVCEASIKTRLIELRQSRFMKALQDANPLRCGGPISTRSMTV
jgi:hypothetical protein